MNKQKVFLIVAGLLFLSAALALFIWNESEDRAAGDAAAKVVSQLRPRQTAGSRENDTPTLDPDRPMPAENIDGYDYIGTLTIPSLALELPVIGEWSYPALKIAPCRFSGSVYRDDLVLAAHNYDRHFGTLKRLHAGDAVAFTDMDGTVFSYEVIQTQEISPQDADAMLDGDWDLTLFTCTPGGAFRFAVRCKKTDASNGD